MSREDLSILSATEISKLVHQKDVSVREVATAVIARLDGVNPHINAVVEYRPEEIIRRAEELDIALAKGESVGTLAGVPVTIKASIDQIGFATTDGVRAREHEFPPSNSAVVDHLLKSGALLIGRTNTAAFSYRWFTENRLYGSTRNPHNPSLTPGGSSGGAAAAVAAGLGAIAIGTDLAGSIRYPAYACGVHGLRPSFGRVARFNPTDPEKVPIGVQLMAVTGPVARTVNDLRLAMDVIAREDIRDPWWVPAPMVGYDAPKCAAFCVRPNGLDTQPDVADALYDAAGKLRDAGWTVVELEDIPSLRSASDIQLTLWLGEDYEGQLLAVQEDGDPGALNFLNMYREFAHSVSLVNYSSALSRLHTIACEWQQFLSEKFAVILLPTSAELPFSNNLDLECETSFMRVWNSQMPMLTLPVTGLPCVNLRTNLISTPSGETIPVGIQIVSARFREDLCLKAAEDIEKRGEPVEVVTP
ncbi:amidase family protein [Xenorhabdus bovienii]|uniref:Amidase n=2 Tax=Xenorhabdus bovienii TaxID=40576 RepID=A0A077NIT1_XENBV|nr:amidase family protein [Xenorhabdus bovienii]MCG3470563.1 amidase family protein [Xenorhabdus bovienii]CDG98327.1 Amidase [Xenorhabdus bovienii str. puntauvense]CDH00000.1 Amidase [Xenorhabdus bovienii str. feltiae Moldova]